MKGAPDQLTLFVTDRCNARCGHCFNAAALNRGAALLPASRLTALAAEAAPARLNLSGGEPFLFSGLGELVASFAARGTRQVFIPTNGLLPERTRVEVERLLLRRMGRLRVVVSLSLDGTEAVHDRIRGVPGGYRKLMETYGELARLKASPLGERLTLRVGTVLCNANAAVVPELIAVVRDEMPAVAFHNFEILRGRAPDGSLAAPSPEELERLRPHVFAAWGRGAFLGGGRPLRSWLARAVKRYVFTLHVETLKRGRPLIPCRAGTESAVVDDEGGVSFCEERERLGSLRTSTLADLWRSARARDVRASIARGECHCVQSCFQQRNVVSNPRLWPHVALHALTGRFKTPGTPAARDVR